LRLRQGSTDSGDFERRLGIDLRRDVILMTPDETGLDRESVHESAKNEDDGPTLLVARFVEPSLPVLLARELAP
jgi:hypothetical protein